MSLRKLTDKFSALLSVSGAPSEGVKLEVTVRGFDVLLAEGDKKGEYRLGIRSNGKNPLYPAEEHAKEIHLTKSVDQFNLVRTPVVRIAADHDYSRIVLAVVPPQERQRNFGLVDLNNPKSELCVLTYICGKDGVEKLWAGMGIERLMPRLPKPQTRDLTAA